MLDSPAIAGQFHPHVICPGPIETVRVVPKRWRMFHQHRRGQPGACLLRCWERRQRNHGWQRSGRRGRGGSSPESGAESSCGRHGGWRGDGLRDGRASEGLLRCRMSRFCSALARLGLNRIKGGPSSNVPTSAFKLDSPWIAWFCFSRISGSHKRFSCVGTDIMLEGWQVIGVHITWIDGTNISEINHASTLCKDLHS